MDHFVIGVVLACLSAWGIRKVRTQLSITSAHQLIYWFFPHSEIALKCRIPSYIREYHS